jgi:hypothetical protein
MTQEDKLSFPMSAETLPESSSSSSRRHFLKFTTLLAGAGSLGACTPLRPAPGGKPNEWPRYVLRRNIDDLYLELQAVGYTETRMLGKRWLAPVADDALLVFSFPPQHFAETALTIAPLPATVSDADLGKLALVASQPSQIVLRARTRQKLQLRLEALLDWTAFDLVLPGTELRNAPMYSLEVDADERAPTTRVEMPWGVELLPIADDAADAGDYVWQHAIAPRTAAGWTELWTTALARRSRRTAVMEVLSVRGFEQVSMTGGVAAGTLQVTYKNKDGINLPSGPTPLSSLDRINLAASLSPRFPYTGQPGTTPIESAKVVYQQLNNVPPRNVCVAACYADGRSVTVEQFRLSARGGWLQLAGQWQAIPGCGLSGWIHASSLGRDHHVEVIAAGFLFPFGTPCQLTVLSERVFVRDERGHFVAVLNKQAFLQIPEGNSVAIEHKESPFVSLAVTTRCTPALDEVPGGDPDAYLKYDFFLPTVNKQPFAFEHIGTDWAGDTHASALPMYFVNNNARAANGLIWEPGSFPYSQRNAPCDPPRPGPSDAPHAIPTSGSDGLRVVDKEWNRQAFRFSSYGGALVALAKPGSKGDTSQRVDWIEWVRGNNMELGPKGIAVRPFRPRARTMKLRLEGISQMSGEQTAVIGCYRDTRAVAIPLLDPDPTAPAELYFRNVQPGGDDPATPYIYLLEARPLLSEAGTPAPSSRQERGRQMRDSYFGRSTAPLPETLFSNLDNEIGFGRSRSAESVGGLSAPDTHASTLSRMYGPTGDATFNERRWPGYAAKKPALAQAGRVDFAAFRRQARKFVDAQPFDPVRTEAELLAFAQQARSLMGFAAPPVPFVAGPLPAGLPAPGLKLGELFGPDAEILPGLSFAKIFEHVACGDVPDATTALVGADRRAAQPLAWNVRITGIEPLLALTGNGPGQLSLPEVLALLAKDAHDYAVSEPIAAGVEASLHWTNDIFRPVRIAPGLVEFNPGPNPRIEIDARSRIDLGRVRVAPDLRRLTFEPGRPVASAKASVSDVSVTLFDAIIVNFARIAFEVSPEGKKDFTTEIASIELTGALSFVNQLSAILQGIGGDQGIRTDLSPARVTISQTLRFPPTEGDPLYVGPAQIINLALSWSVSVPLLGRDVLSVAFGISSREKPLTIFVPPWYGGKAHVLLELTTKGCRLIEVSMEYGALIPVTWTLARGTASLTAGIFYLCQRTAQGGSVELTAFVKAACDLKVAGLIRFSGLIYIALTRKDDSTLHGIATVRVSIKIAFVRVSYSFTAKREEKRHGESLQLTQALAGADPHGLQLFGKQFNDERRQAFERLIQGYAPSEPGL